MTSRDLAALLRADPKRAGFAIEEAKIAGPWRKQEDGRMMRVCYGGGARYAANEDAQDWHDADLLRLGWTLE